LPDRDGVGLAYGFLKLREPFDNQVFLFVETITVSPGHSPAVGILIDDAINPFVNIPPVGVLIEWVDGDIRYPFVSGIVVTDIVPVKIAVLKTHPGTDQT